MKRVDSVFGRLAAAWKPLVRSVEAPSSAELWRGLIAPPTGSASLWPSSLPLESDDQPRLQPGVHKPVGGAPATLAPLILLATLPADRLAPIDAGALGRALTLASALGAAERFRCVPVTPLTADDLERTLCRLQPRLLLIDAPLVERLDPDVMRRIHRRLPGTDWLLLWSEPTMAAFELAVRAQMRGCIDWHARPEHYERAFHAVIAGDVWFPRQAMQSLYLSLLAATQTHGTSGPVPLDEAAAGTSDERGGDLTEREVDVLVLMRQGLTNKQIGDRLDISINTVKKHLAHAFEKRGLHNRRQAIG
jgi:two-component system nitrate/nitrite response regulator NarL